MEVNNLKLSREKVNKILNTDNSVMSINENIKYLLDVIPELNYMIGFEHKHPHHHLDVWQHTLESLNNLNTNDL